MMFPSTSTGSSVSTLTFPEFNFASFPSELNSIVSLFFVIIAETPLIILSIPLKGI